MAQRNEIEQHLLGGGQISNGPQRIFYDYETQQGYLTCYDPGCCNETFDSLAEIMNWIDFVNDNTDEWDIVAQRSE